MTKKSRYFLILLGITVFLIIAPLLVLYIRGLTFDFGTKSFRQTGILALVADPKKSAVYLDGKLMRTGSGDIKFLKAGEYEVQISYPGYFGWNKRLPVNSGQVTWANPGNGKIYLFLSDPKAKTLANSATDFYSRGNFLLYLQNQSAVASSISDPEIKKIFPLPKPADKILTADDASQNFILTNEKNNLIFLNVGSGQSLDLTGLFKKSVKFQFAEGSLYALEDRVLYLVDPQAKSKKIILSGLYDFFLQGQDLYVIRQSAGGLEIALSRISDPSNFQTLIDDLPNFKEPKILVSLNKQVFISSMGNLYSASLEMKQLASSLQSLNFEPQKTEIPLVQSGEFDFFDTVGQKLNFVTRSVNYINNPQLVLDIDYAFYSTEDKIKAIELDTRGGQNSYTLYSGQNIQKFTVDGSGQNILLLDNGEIKNITIR